MNKEPGATNVKPSYAIIGAGPAGLAAGYEAVSSGDDCVVLEAGTQVGGLSQTLYYKGYGFDIGGHRFFTKLKEVSDFWHRILPEDFLQKERQSRIYYRGNFFRYPLRLGDAMFGLGVVQGATVFGSFIKAQLTPNAEEKSFEDWVTNRFGHALYSIFFKSYTEKVWGVSCSKISADWAAQRIKDLNLSKAALNALGFYRKSGSATLSGTFDYPRLGPGQMYQAIRKRIEEKGSAVLPEHKVVRISHENNSIRSVTVTTPDGEKIIEAQRYISSMGIDELIRAMHPAPPAEVVNIAQSLQYRAIVTANLIVDMDKISPDNWIYLHSPEIRAGRMQIYKNWSPDLIPDQGKSSVGLEYFASIDDDLWKMSDNKILEMAKEDMDRLGLVQKAKVIDGCAVRYGPAYPVYDVGYALRLKTLKEYLSKFRNLCCIGRAGQFRYNNMDHSIYTGMLAVRMFRGAKVDPWDVNVDKEYIES